MVAYTDSLGFNKGTGPLPDDALAKVFVADVTLDFVKIATYRTNAGVAALAVGDTLVAMIIPAKVIVENVGMELITASSNATATIAIGDSSAAAGYLAAQALATPGIYGGVPVLSAGAYAPTLSGGKAYYTADTLLLTFGTAIPTAAVVRIFATISDLS